MSIDYKRFLDVIHIDLSRKVMGRKLSSKCNSDLLRFITAMISFKNPSGLIGRYIEHRNNNSLIVMLDNLGTILPIRFVGGKCKVCRKNQITHAHISPDNYYTSDKPLICNQCLQGCIEFSNQYIIELALPNIFKFYCLFKQTTIFKNLVNDVSYYIFYMSLL